MTQVSGTFNPPHRGHVRLGLFAKERLEKLGHEVQVLLPTWGGREIGWLLAKKQPKKPGEKWVGMGGFWVVPPPPHQKKGVG